MHKTEKSPVIKYYVAVAYYSTTADCHEVTAKRSHKNPTKTWKDTHVPTLQKKQLHIRPRKMQSAWWIL